jgi:hypothetical protein
LPALLVTVTAVGLLATSFTPTADAAPDLGNCAAGRDQANLVPVRATANDEFTQAFRQFGNSGGGWSNEGGWAASDGVYSADLPGGKIVWLMNDTFLGPVNDDESMTEPGFIHGSIVTGGRDGLPDTTITGGTQDQPESIASPPDAVNGDPWYWNVDGIMDGGKLRVFQARTGKTDGEPPWNFGWVGTDIVTYAKDFTVESVTRTYGTPGWVNWGNELIRCGGTVYIYGQKDGSAYVARTRTGQLLKRNWEFFTGSGWSNDETAAAPIAGDVGASYSVTPMNGQFVLTTTATGIFFDHTVYVATGSSPAGPFTGRTAIYTAPEGGTGNLYAPYNVAAHPVISEPGELVISYNVNSGVGDDLLANANNNRPRFVTIEFDAT